MTELTDEAFEKFQAQARGQIPKYPGKRVYPVFMKIHEQTMREGIKTWTTRSKYIGQVGDWFKYFGKTFEIVERKRMLLGEVVEEHYTEEGFRTSANMARVWVLLHPVIGYNPKRNVFVHIFREKIEDE